VIGALAGYFFQRYRMEQAAKARREKADDILKIANEQARLIGNDARENATKLIQVSESEIKERRLELNKEVERLEKRRSELDMRFDKIEQREQTLNKRQSQVDKRANEIEKLYEDQVKKLEQIAQLTPDEPKKNCSRL
jgi:ribonuclease Y